MTDQFAAGMRRAADIVAEMANNHADMALTGLSENARNREAMEAALTKARYAILAAIPAPALWTPPPEAERSDGYRCLGKCELGWEEIVWDGEIWRDTCGAPIGADIAHFHPLPHRTDPRTGGREMSDTDGLIARAEAALEGVTEGKWEVRGKQTVGYGVRTICKTTWQNGKADARFIATARQLVPDLLAHIAAQAAEIARLRAERPGLWCAGRDAAADWHKSQAENLRALVEDHKDRDDRRFPELVDDWAEKADRHDMMEGTLRALTPPDTEGRR